MEVTSLETYSISKLSRICVKMGCSTASQVISSNIPLKMRISRLYHQNSELVASMDVVFLHTLKEVCKWSISLGFIIITPA